MKKSFLLFAVCAGIFLPTLSVRADVKLHPLFSDNMVLQRDKPLPVWGTARSNEKVSVSIGTRVGSTQADASGNWRAMIAPLKAATGLQMTVKGDNQIQLQNVAVGDVYICSGQSNMEWPLAAAIDAAAEIASANYPNIRLFTVPKKVAGERQKEFAAPTNWQVCAPGTVGDFSAVGYFFGRELNSKLGVPIGLIDSSWGGTIAQAWTSRSTLLKRDDLREETLQTERAFREDNTLSLAERTTAWWAANDKGVASAWSTPGFDDAAWAAMNVPNAWENAGAANFDGVMWFRKTVDIPAAWEGRDLTLHLGAIDDRDTTFWNGEKIGETNAYNQARHYKIPAASVHAGRATIAIRVLDTGGAGGLTGGDALRLEVAGDANQKLDLSGPWKYQSGAALQALTPIPVEIAGNPNQPTVLFNGMIAPLIPFSVRGAIWYQGESNAGNAAQYQTLFPDLIRDWRSAWNARQDGSEFGFYFVQLANYMARVPEPTQDGWANLRDAQTQTLKAVPRTGMATIIDIGEAGDIHPRNKQDVGKRLALAALAREYGQRLEYSGPTFSKMEIVPNTNRVRISFSHAAGLTVKIAPPVAANQGEYPDVPLDHWAYNAINKLVQDGIIEGFPPGTYNGARAVSRYEFAVAIARMIEKVKFGPDPTRVPGQPVNRKGIYFDDWTTYSQDAFMALKAEFAIELRALGVRTDDLDRRFETEGVLKKPPVFTQTKTQQPKTQQPKLLGASVKGFAIRGEDGKWYLAQAHLDGETVVLWSDEVLIPKAVRYAWANNPDVNLVNGAGLPAVPFRTDAP